MTGASPTELRRPRIREGWFPKGSSEALTRGRWILRKGLGICGRTGPEAGEILASHLGSEQMAGLIKSLPLRQNWVALEILLYLHPWTFCTSSLSSLPPSFWTSDTVHTELQSTPQTSTLQAGGEWGRGGGGLWGSGPGTDTVPPFAPTPWVLSYPFEPAALNPLV